MLLPNSEQLKQTLRAGIIALGGFLVGKGWVTSETIQAVANSEVIIGLVVAAITWGWGYIARSNKNLVVAADSVPGVKGVVTNATQEGIALANSIPSPSVAPAGTTQAANVASTTEKKGK